VGSSRGLKRCSVSGEATRAIGGSVGGCEGIGMVKRGGLAGRGEGPRAGGWSLASHCDGRSVDGEAEAELEE
jgi:hypothetical protein